MKNKNKQKFSTENVLMSILFCYFILGIIIISAGFFISITKSENTNEKNKCQDFYFDTCQTTLKDSLQNSIYEINLRNDVLIDNTKTTNSNVEMGFDDITTDFVLALIKKYDINFPHIVLAQSILESGYYKSDIAKTNNNIFGMKNVKNRKCCGRNGKKYQVYDSIEESIKDYKLWQEYYNVNDKMSKTEYLKLLNTIYHNDKNYTHKLNYIVKKYKKNENIY